MFYLENRRKAELDFNTTAVKFTSHAQHNFLQLVRTPCYNVHKFYTSVFLVIYFCVSFHFGPLKHG